MSKLPIIFLCCLLSISTWSQQASESLDRGLIAILQGEEVFLSWRIFPEDIEAQNTYRVYRDGTLISETPLAMVSNFIDPDGSRASNYHVEINQGNELVETTQSITPWDNEYLEIPTQTPAGYTLNDASIGDLNGDGHHEVIVKLEKTSHDNAHSGYTDPVYLHAYTMQGDFLWSIDLGINIRAGAHYTQFMVFDLDGDGMAEIACKTAPGTKDGMGQFLSDGPAAADDDQVDYRNNDGYILRGPEYLTVFDGQTGAEINTVKYDPPRHPDTEFPSPAQIKSIWGDDYGNRVDRFLACVAYFDEKPSLVMCRGYYTRTVLAAWDFDGEQLSQRWLFDSKGPYASYRGQGAHSLTVGDVDSDGKDEIMYGAMAIDDDGTPLYNTMFRHGDATHLSDLLPYREGLEFFMPHESAGSTILGVTIPGISIRDAMTGEIIWQVGANGDIGRGLTADISADHPGHEFWASSGLGVYNSFGDKISSNIPSINFAVWWDGDLTRELLDKNTISKWSPSSTNTLFTATGCTSNNGTKSTPALSGDLLGDWREEVIWRTEDNQALRIYSTTIPTDIGMPSLLFDRQYRLAIAWQNVGYNQPPHPGFYLGSGMEQTSTTNVYESVDFLVFPNPANDIIHIQLKDPEEFMQTLHIYSVSGEIIEFFQQDSSLNSINISGLTDGLYTIIGKTNKRYVRQNILIQ